jgi:hypothetical protein
MVNTQVVLNSVPGCKICHAWGLCHGDLLSPMLFLLVMEVVNTLIRKADDWSPFIRKLGARAIPHRASIYVDDLILFVSPIASDLQLVSDILNMFKVASGLGCNL